ncbi:MAG: hypothetical protein JWM96_1070 [Alphaproteobacteria bacterium]|nr:hypothetical protein [Alphaproteobacteria bacterium]
MEKIYTITAEKVVAGFSEWDCLDPSKRNVWKQDDTIIKFDTRQLLIEEKLNAALLQATGKRTVKSTILPLQQEDFARLRLDYQAAWPGADNILVMPEVVGSRFDQAMAKATQDDKKRLLKDFSDLIVPYMLTGFSDQHQKNIIVEESSGELVTLDTYPALFEEGQFFGNAQSMEIVYETTPFNGFIKLNMYCPDKDRLIQQCDEAEQHLQEHFPVEEVDVLLTELKAVAPKFRENLKDLKGSDVRETMLARTRELRDYLRK